MMSKRKRYPIVHALMAALGLVALVALALTSNPTVVDADEPMPQQNYGDIGNISNNAGNQQHLGDAEMAVANDAASKVVRKRMETERPDDFAALQDVKSAEIIVIHGSMDRVQDVLGAVGVPHTLISPAQLDQIELDARQLVMINCPGTLSEKGIKKIQKFVRAGGFLYTTDWALTNVIQKAFPGIIAYNDRPTQNDVVEVQVTDTDNVFLQHVNLSKTSPKWWLEGSSYPVKVLDKSKVKVLISSKEMKQKYGEAPVAVLFNYGDGQVLHIVSHFYLQQNDKRTLAEQQSGDSYLKNQANLPAAVADELADDESVKKASAGDINSAYANQQFTTNIVVERKKDQARVDGMYDKSINDDADFSEDGDKGTIKKGSRVKVVERKGNKAKVRALNGDEAWVDFDMVE